MKTISILMLMFVTALLLPAQEAKPAAPKAPKENIISSYRVFARPGHDAALATALGEHARKFHTGRWKWRVYSVLSGPDGGAYLIVEGPNSWTALDDRGDLGAEHVQDYDTNVAPHVERSTPDIYLSYQDELSTVALAAFSTKATITRVYPKPGRGPAVRETLKTWKKIWEKRGFNVVVYSTVNSGPLCYNLVTRLKNGWKDYDAEPAMTQEKAFEEVGGPNAYALVLEEMAEHTESVIGEMIELKPELSSR